METYRITLKHRYMILPINIHTKRKKIFIHEGDTLLWDFDAAIDLLTPSYHTYMNISHLMGKTVTITSSPRIDLHFDFCDELPDDVGADEPYRPMVHFTARYGWTNDPNGLVYVNGIYHMFFQHNPADSQWGNMTWGHAVSDDLFHWKQLDSALYPDERGTIFSGSAIVDRQRVSGLGTDDCPPVLFYYTAAGSNSALSANQPFTQCLAYSTDGGMTLQKYEGNPIVGHILDSNRDPKVVYCAETGGYIMALYLTRDEYALLSSPDLVHFEEMQRLCLQGDGECPDIYPLEVEGEPGNRKWVFSGASDYYMIGEFRAGKFTVVQGTRPYAYCNERRTYAAQTFSDIPDRRIKIAWNQFHAPEACFESQMGIPTEVSLCRIGEEYRLRTTPCREFEALRERSTRYAVRTADLTVPLDRRAYDLSLTMEKNSPDITLRFFGYEFHIRPSANLLVFEGGELPLSYTGDSVRLRIVSDVLGCEIFADDGLIYTVCARVADYNLRYLTVVPTDLTAIPQAELTVHELQSV